MLLDPARQVSALDAMLDLDHPVKRAATEWGDEMLPLRDGIEPSWVVDRPVWSAFGDSGLLGAFLPAEPKGPTPSAVEVMLVLEGLGASGADNGVVFAAATQAVAANRAVGLSATPEQYERWRDDLAGGRQFVSFAMSEPDAGSDAWSIRTRAEPIDGGGWVLSGTKAWVTLGPICDRALVFAVTDPAKGRWGISAFMVDASADGFERRPTEPKMGLNACPFGELVLDRCRVDAGDRLGGDGAGGAVFTSVVEVERAVLYAAQLGAVERVIAAATEHARSRWQGGRHIGAW